MPLNGNTIVSASAGALCDRDPLEPDKMIELAPIGVATGTDTVNCSFESAAIVSGNTGVVVAPVGSPEIAIETLPVKPLSALIETVIGALVPPCATLTDAVVEIEKSGGGGGGGGVVPPPQATRKQTIVNSSARGHRLEMAPSRAVIAVRGILERDSELGFSRRLVFMRVFLWSNESEGIMLHIGAQGGRCAPKFLRRIIPPSREGVNMQFCIGRVEWD
jgi:hypothetical protein